MCCVFLKVTAWFKMIIIKATKFTLKTVQTTFFAFSKKYTLNKGIWQQKKVLKISSNSKTNSDIKIRVLIYYFPSKSGTLM